MKNEDIKNNGVFINIQHVNYLIKFNGKVIPLGIIRGNYPLKINLKKK